LSDRKSFTLTVNNVNRAPTLAAIADQSMNEGTTLDVAVSATDPDGDGITLAVNNLPQFGSFTDNHNGTGTIHFAPGFEDAGVYSSIEVVATDDGTPNLSDKKSFTLTVNNVNRAPALTPIADQTMNEGEVLEIPISATDPDGDVITLSVNNLPRFGSFTDNLNGTGTIRFAPGLDDAGVYSNIQVTATDAGNLSAAVTFTLTVIDFGVEPLSCQVEIIKPADRSFTCEDSIEVCLTAKASGGVAPITKDCKVNGIPVTDSCVKVPLVSGNNAIVAHCTFTDALGASTSCVDTVRVFADLMTCSVSIIAPVDGSFICDNSVKVVATTKLTGGIAPIQKTCTINGKLANIDGDKIRRKVDLDAGYNTIIATCTFVDSLGCSATCSDTITVFSDPTPPVCKLDFNNLPIITGQAIDNESGIAEIEVIELRNRTIAIDPFTVGDHNVGFVLDRSDPNETTAFTLKITNRAGCATICDPVGITLRPAAEGNNFALTIPGSDRYLFVSNHGLTRIDVTINERSVDLVATPEGVGREGNTYFIPFFGSRSIDIGDHLFEGENQVTLAGAGPDGAKADILLSDVNIGEVTTIVREDRQNTPVPEVFVLKQNYPNPFNPETTITFEVPAGWTLPITLRIHDLQGRFITTLVDEVMSPGNHQVVWNGRDAAGRQVATGVYFYQIISGEFGAVKKMLLTK
jgi:hypothetical protein